MTNEQLMALDRLVAIHVTKWPEWTQYDMPPRDMECFYADDLGDGTVIVYHDGRGFGDYEQWQPTIDLNQCAEMERKLLIAGNSLVVYVASGSDAIFFYDAVYEDMHDRRMGAWRSNESEPLARVLSALMAVLHADFERTLKDAGVEV